MAGEAIGAVPGAVGAVPGAVGAVRAGWAAVPAATWGILKVSLASNSSRLPAFQFLTER
jgi:hypothetical protein